MNNWKVIPTIVLATVLIFGAGVLTGGMLIDHINQSRAHAPKHPAGAVTNALAVMTGTNSAPGKLKPPEILSKDLLQRLDSDLKLTKDQHDAIQKIITDNQNLMHKVVQDARLEIRETLTADQRQLFDELIKRPTHRPLVGTNGPPAIVASNTLSTATNQP